MSDLRELIDVASAAARKGLDPTPVLEVRLEDILGQDGDPMIQVMVVVPDDKFDEIDGTHFLSALLNIQDSIRNAGDDRLTLIGYATLSELRNGNS